MKSKLFAVIAFVLGTSSLAFAAAPLAPPSGFGAWQTAKVGDFMTVKVPGKFKVTSVELDSEVRKKIDLMETYTLDNVNANDYQCLVSYVIYNKGIMADLDGAAEGSITNMSKEASISDFKVEKKYIALPGAKGILITGTYKADGKKGVFRSEIFVKRNNLWMVITMDLTGDTMGKITTAILNSIAINAK